MLPLQKKVKLDDDFSKKKELVSALLSSSKNGCSRQKALAEEKDEEEIFLLPAPLSFLSFFSRSLSLCIALERAQSFFKADEAVCF